MNKCCLHELEITHSFCKECMKEIYKNLDWSVGQIENRLNYLWGQYQGKHKDNPFIGSEITFLQEILKNLKGQSPKTKPVGETPG